MVEKYMELAINEAKKAFNNGEVPIGSIIVKDGKVIGRGHNKKKEMNSIVSHAEINAILMASNNINNWRLDGCDIYVTLEPCPMCASAIKQSRIKNVYCGLSNLDTNNKNIIKLIFEADKINGKVNLHYYEKEEVRFLLQSFFKNRRNK